MIDDRGCGRVEGRPFDDADPDDRVARREPILTFIAVAVITQAIFLMLSRQGCEFTA